VGPILTALTGALLYRIGRTLGWRRTTAVIVPVAFGILTMAAVYSTELFSEPAVTLGTVSWCSVSSGGATTPQSGPGSSAAASRSRSWLDSILWCSYSRS
jgi:hypothetical protein